MSAGGDPCPKEVAPPASVLKDGLVDHDKLLSQLDILDTVGTGTFGRVILCKNKDGPVSALKVMKLTQILQLRQVQHVVNEKSVLQSISHPFIVNMHWAGKSKFYIYLMFEYVPGGELFSYLRNAGHFSESTSLFYAAEIVSAIDYLHKLSIVYRDLKPENLLLDKQGHVKITDFGFAKRLEDRTWTLCGTPEYLAPEIIQSKGHNKAVDWWALGVFIYEMLVGIPPFYDEKAFGIYQKILSGKVEWPKSMDRLAKDLIKKLLVQDRTRRLGNMKNGSLDVKSHKWFKDIDWDDVLNRKLKPPIVPVLTSETDTANFEEYDNSEEWFKMTQPLDDKSFTAFDNF
ncbi:cAMP-dependent protein kinase catalytic subunit PRKX-like [Watersipora subatra]|uniref:cAMP-dependent protein kinase catalytic subunit PRKX-like n=1 Tax=Watersipora subatra TaxID=2589382 RepID=UPI00355BDC18